MNPTDIKYLNKFKKLKDEMQWSNVYLADVFVVSVSTIDRWLNKKARPKSRAHREMITWFCRIYRQLLIKFNNQENRRKWMISHNANLGHIPEDLIKLDIVHFVGVMWYLEAILGQP